MMRDMPFLGAQTPEDTPEEGAPEDAPKEGSLGRTAAGFGLAAAVAMVVNTVLVWIKDSYDPLSSFMAALTGHGWITHGLADLAVFLLLGWLFTRRGVGWDGYRLVIAVTVAAVLGGAGLAAWFVLF